LFPVAARRLLRYLRRMTRILRPAIAILLAMLLSLAGAIAVMAASAPPGTIPICTGAGTVDAPSKDAPAAGTLCPDCVMAAVGVLPATGMASRPVCRASLLAPTVRPADMPCLVVRAPRARAPPALV
jgi:hypothetical protein